MSPSWQYVLQYCADSKPYSTGNIGPTCLGSLLLPFALTSSRYSIVIISGIQFQLQFDRQTLKMAHSSATADLSVPSIFNFKSYVVLVTGGATGLGEMAAQAFVQNGAKVIIASRKQKELEATANRLNKLGPGSCDYVVADLKNKAGCLELCKKVKEKTDRLTVLMNNSGATW